MNKTPLFAASTAAFGMAMLAMPGIASAAEGSSYQATLQAMNHSSGSGTVSIQLNGSQATVTEKVSGLAETFGGKPYPHVQHIHIGAKGTCPDASADKDGDDVVSTTEGASFYGPVGATLSTSGDTSPAATATLGVAPSGGSFTYSRTFTLDDKTMQSLKAGTAVAVVHGLDPSTLSKKAQDAKSDLVPSLPLAATSPALCGTLKVSQMSAMPSGGAATGGGSTSAMQNEGLMAAGAALLAAGAITGGVALRRRSSTTI